MKRIILLSLVTGCIAVILRFALSDFSIKSRMRDLSSQNIPLLATESEGVLTIEFPDDLEITSIGTGRVFSRISVTFKGSQKRSGYRKLDLDLRDFSNMSQDEIRLLPVPRSSLNRSLKSFEHLTGK